MTATESENHGLQRVGTGSSLTRRTTKALLDAILNRQFPDNKLPPEPELAGLLAVSRTTIRAALQALERLGVLSRAPGRGTLVRAHVGRESIVLQRLIGFRGLLQERHSDVQVDQKYWIRDHADEFAVKALKIPADSRVIVTSKTFLADGHPAIHITDQIPLDNCDAATRARLEAGEQPPPHDSIFEFSRSWPGKEIDHTVVELVPSVAQPGNTQLEIDPGTPFMTLLETHHNLTGDPVAVSRVQVDDRYVRFNVVRHE